MGEAATASGTRGRHGEEWRSVDSHPPKYRARVRVRVPATRPSATKDRPLALALAFAFAGGGPALGRPRGRRDRRVGHLGAWVGAF